MFGDRTAYAAPRVSAATTGPRFEIKAAFYNLFAHLKVCGPNRSMSFMASFAAHSEYLTKPLSQYIFMSHRMSVSRKGEA